MQNEKKTRYIINQCFNNIFIHGSTMNVEKNISRYEIKKTYVRNEVLEHYLIMKQTASSESNIFLNFMKDYFFGVKFEKP